MRISEKYYYLITVSIFFLSAIIIVLVWHFRAQVFPQQKKHIPAQVKNASFDITRVVPTLAGKRLTFTDKTMHLTFTYPENLQVKKLSDQLVAINNGKKIGENDSELVYITPAIKGNTEVTAPFQVEGQISQTLKIQVNNFNARLVTFKNGSETAQLFFLRSNTRVIIIRPPKSNAIYPDTVYSIVQSIQEIM